MSNNAPDYNDNLYFDRKENMLEKDNNFISYYEEYKFLNKGKTSYHRDKVFTLMLINFLMILLCSFDYVIIPAVNLLLIAVKDSISLSIFDSKIYNLFDNMKRGVSFKGYCNSMKTYKRAILCDIIELYLLVSTFAYAFCALWSIYK